MNCFRKLHASFFSFLGLGLAMILAANLSSCITTQPLEEFIVYESKPTAIRDTFNFVYRKEKFDSTLSPKAIYTLSFWSPQFYEFENPVIFSVDLKPYKNSYWVARVPLPDNARIVSYKLTGVSPEDTGKYQHYHVFLNDAPVSETFYRLALAKNFAGEPIDSVLFYLLKERALYPKNFYTYTAYWHYFHQKYGGTDSIKAVIAQDITNGFKVFYNDYGYLQSIGLTYAYTLNEKQKAFESMKQLYDNFLHPLNLVTRFQIEYQNDRKESILRILSDKYSGLSLTTDLHFKQLYDYMTDKNPDSITVTRQNLGKIFAEITATNRRTPALKNSRFTSMAIRYLYRRYAEGGYSRVVPNYVREVIQPNYDKDIFDVITLIKLGYFLSGSTDLAGFAVEESDRAIALLEQPSFLKYNESSEVETIESPVLNEILREDLRGQAYYNMYRAYFRLGDVVNAKSRFELAEKFLFSQKVELLKDAAYQLAKDSKKADEAFLQMAKAYALKPDPTILQWLRDTSRSRLKNQKLEERIKSIREKESMTMPSFSLKGVDGREFSENDLKGKLAVIFVWSNRSRLSKSFLYDLQVQYSKFRTRGVSFYAISPYLISLGSEGNNFGEQTQYSYDFFQAPISFFENLKAPYLPSAFIIKNGKVILRLDGYQKGFISQLEQAVQFFLNDDLLGTGKKSN
ncbi:MAG: redoxin domain-containing protein [Chloroherpetonaceae bacterium]|nr:redoxin domain-containing protein [Chloroherpetonaceae bacterium]